MKITKDENHMCIGGVDIINDLKAICERIVAGQKVEMLTCSVAIVFRERRT